MKLYSSLSSAAMRLMNPVVKRKVANDDGRARQAAEGSKGPVLEGAHGEDGAFANGAEPALEEEDPGEQQDLEDTDDGGENAIGWHDAAIEVDVNDGPRERADTHHKGGPGGDFVHVGGPGTKACLELLGGLIVEVEVTTTTTAAAALLWGFLSLKRGLGIRLVDGHRNHGLLNGDRLDGNGRLDCISGHCGLGGRGRRLGPDGLALGPFGLVGDLHHVVGGEEAGHATDLALPPVRFSVIVDFDNITHFQRDIVTIDGYECMGRLALVQDRPRHPLRAVDVPDLWGQAVG
jgi:hypothetical protein